MESLSKSHSSARGSSWAWKRLKMPDQANNVTTLVHGELVDVEIVDAKSAKNIDSSTMVVEIDKETRSPNPEAKSSAENRIGFEWSDFLFGSQTPQNPAEEVRDDIEQRNHEKNPAIVGVEPLIVQAVDASSEPNDVETRQDESEPFFLTNWFACLNPTTDEHETSKQGEKEHGEEEEDQIHKIVSNMLFFEDESDKDKDGNAGATEKSVEMGSMATYSLKADDFEQIEDLETSTKDHNSYTSDVAAKVHAFSTSLKKTGAPSKLKADDGNEKNASSNMEVRRQLLIRELRSTINAFGRYDVRAANICAALGDVLNETERYDQAIRLHRDAVDIYSSKLGDHHSMTLDAKIQLARILENAQQYDEAINLFYLVTVMRRALKGDNDPSVADGLVFMSGALRKKGEYQQAIKELKRALKLYRESLGDAHLKVSMTVDEIASLYVTVGDFEKSAAILEEVVKLKAATQGMKSTAVATTLLQLATTYECSEDFEKAMKSLKKAYKIYTEVEGYSSKDATSTLNSIAKLYEATDDMDRASIAYLGVLRGRKINYGENHLLVGESYYKLGHVLRETGQQEKALRCMKEALPIYVGKGVEMEDIEMIAEIMHEMALINEEKKRFHEASKIFKQELGVRRKIGQPEYPTVARTLNHLGVVEWELKNNTKSLKYLVEALNIFKIHGKQSVECAEVLFNTGLVFESSKNRDRALEAYEEAARIFRSHGYTDSHPHLFKANRKIQKLQSQRIGRRF